MGTITLSEKEQRRADILSKASTGALSMQQVAGLLHVTEGQVRRLLSRYRADGLPSVIHGNRGRSAVNRTANEIRQKLRELADKEGKYHDFNTCHMQELLAERDAIQIGRSTLDRLLIEAGVRKRKRSRPRRVFRHRERVEKEGQMLLTDGSPHDWLEGRDNRYREICLKGGIEEARGMIVHLRFWPTECQAGYIMMAREVTKEFGIPMSFYHDRHTILVSPCVPTIEDELAGREPMSQFQAILAQLGAESIRALTPQAKGRIERMWKTLQERLTKEMRLAGINTLEEANAFLPDYIQRYNAHFSSAAADPAPAWVKPDAASEGDMAALEALDLPYYFAAKEERTVRADHTLSFRGKIFSIQRKRFERSLAAERVQVHTTPEGECFVYHGKQRLQYKQVTSRPATPKLPQTQAPVPVIWQPALTPAL